LNYRFNRTQRMIEEVEREHQSNQVQITETIAALRQAIDDMERSLTESVDGEKKRQWHSIRESKCDIQHAQNELIEQMLKFKQTTNNGKPGTYLEFKQPFQEYMTKMDSRLLELRPMTRTKKHVAGLETLNTFKTQIRNIMLKDVPKYENTRLIQHITNRPNPTILDLARSQLTDLDMEIVATEIAKNQVRTNRRRYHLITICIAHPFKVNYCSKIVCK
jgi:hypothetical protein